MIKPKDLKALRALLADGALLSDPSEGLCYGYDNSKQVVPAEAVALPQSTAEVAAILRYCSQTGIPVVTRGAGTNTVGATVPSQGGLVLSLERMESLVEFAPADRYLHCQAGMRNGAVQQKAGEAGMFWPPDPTSADFSTVGGNLACNAGGPRAVKYGTCRENTLGLTAVTGDGRILHTGSRTTKGVVGLDLTRLLIGSEGGLAVITEAILLLQPRAATTWSVRASYRSVTAAAQAVSAIMAQPVRPCALEFMDGTAVRLVREQASVNVPADTQALLLIKLDGDVQQLERDLEALSRAGRSPDCLDWQVAREEAEAQTVWAARKALSPCLRSIAPKKVNEDVVVPVSCLPELIAGLEKLSTDFDLPIVNFGHAGNGNVHVNIMADPADRDQMQRLDRCLDAVFDLVLQLRGSLSGEHGVGLAKRDFIERELGAEQIALMHQLKAAFDPAGILNPGKSLPPPT